MDSASSALSVASRDAAEDDGSLSVAAGLAKEAALLFQSGKFSECLEILNQLLLQKVDDPKVHHNISLAENLQDGCSNPKKLIESLAKIKKWTEEIVPKGNDGRKLTDDTKGTNIDQLYASSTTHVNGIDTSVTVFNIAAVWFHLHDYSKSFIYLNTLFQNIQPVDEGTALRICLLLLDVALICQNAQRSADVLSYMEKVFCASTLTNQGDNNSSLLAQSFSLQNSSSVANPCPIPDSPCSDRAVGGSHSLENSLSRTLSEEELEDEPLQLLSSLDINDPNFQGGRSVIASSNALMRSRAEDSSIIDLRLKLHLYKVRFFLLTRNLRAAKREVKMGMNLARGKDYPMALYVKSELEFARRNFKKAIKLLMASTDLTEVGISSMYYNDLGCIYFRLGKHHTSGVFFSKALKNSSSLLRQEKQPEKLLAVSQDKSLLILYNCGLHSLACGRPFHAARCFQKASTVLYNRPVLWLRIAECCLLAMGRGLIKCNNSSSPDEKYIEASVVGKGKWRQLVLMNGSSKCGEDSYSLLQQLELSPTLARSCLRNALFLLDSSEAKDSAPSSENSGGCGSESGLGQTVVNSNGEVKEQKTNSNAAFQNSIADYEHMKAKENRLIRQASLADLAYVELALGDPLLALQVAKSLLELPDCSKMYAFFGSVYAAEALCLLNRPTEAAKHLLAYISVGNDVDLPYTREDCENWTPAAEKFIDSEDSNDLASSNPAAVIEKQQPQQQQQQESSYLSPESARGIFYTNHAVNISLMGGDLEQARLLATRALSDIPNDSRAVLTAVYLDLKQGKTQEALAKLKRYGSTRFVPTAPSNRISK
ncbi:hypothetical protein M569_09110 [Genlisea aurea]|uniref:CCR4-NOT transcription complex subunit 10 n=1 Tax=Genlisea aurea TaxID=192259 RepID=S8E021_9LAMI|nr:hypothetical protein M569_09110 [Genlisea aurea]